MVFSLLTMLCSAIFKKIDPGHSCALKAIHIAILCSIKYCFLKSAFYENKFMWKEIKVCSNKIVWHKKNSSSIFLLNFILQTTFFMIFIF